MREDEKWLCTFEISQLGDIIDVQFLGQDFNLIRKSQAALMDEEWALEQIEKDVCRFLYIRYAFRNQEEIDRYMTFFKELPRVEDIETRLFGGMLQWKYEKNKNWRSAVLPD